MTVNILVVEDNLDGADVVRRVLLSSGYHADFAPTAERALEMLSAHPNNYNAIVIDLALPQMDGFELMQIIRSEQAVAALPLVAITAFHTPELRVQALESGFDAYFPKPIDTTAFLQSLRKLTV